MVSLVPVVLQLAVNRGTNAGPLGEALKLTLGCLKEGFNFYQCLGCPSHVRI